MTKKLALAYHNLSVMLDAGMPTLRSLDTTAEGLKGNLKKVFSALAKGISAGNSLAETMSRYPRIFAPLDIILVEVADKSGNLPQSLKLLSQWYEFRNKLKNIILSGLTLPAAIIIIATLILPLPYLILGKITFFNYFLSVFGRLALFAVPVAIIIAIYRFTPKTGLIRRFLDAFTLRIPGLGQAIRQLELSRYCRAFNMLYEAGIPISQCAQKASNVIGNAIIADLFKGGAESAQAGKLKLTNGATNRILRIVIRFAQVNLIMPLPPIIDYQLLPYTLLAQIDDYNTCYYQPYS